MHILHGNTSTDGGVTVSTVPFLIDGASTLTFVNDIALLEPESVTYLTEPEVYNTARAGATITATARTCS